jgi:hypothetical protein
LQGLISDATIRCQWVFIKTGDTSKLNYTEFPHYVSRVFVSPHLDRQLIQEGNAKVGLTYIVTALLLVWRKICTILASLPCNCCNLLPSQSAVCDVVHHISGVSVNVQCFYKNISTKISSIQMVRMSVAPVAL